MNRSELEAALRATFDDRQLSRGERRALAGVLEDAGADPNTLAWLRSRAFALARDAIRGPGDREALDWLEDVVKALDHAAPEPDAPAEVKACFSPNDDCPAQIVALFDRARRAVDICVFTITDDRITAAIEAAIARGVGVRLVTDDDKSFDRGSDVVPLARLGAGVRVDNSPAHMHHKFALFDGVTLLTGSYNWTRSAAGDNQENFVITDDRRLVGAFQAEFERLWEQFGG